MKPPEDPSQAPPDPPVRPRDLEKIREKQPIYLEPRQVLRLALVAVCGLAAAFVGGWWSRGSPPPAPRNEVPAACQCPTATTGIPEAPPALEAARVVRSQVLPQPPEVAPRDAEPLAVAWARRPPDDAPAHPPVPSSTASPMPLSAPPPAVPNAAAPNDPATGLSDRATAQDSPSPGASRSIPLAQRRWSVQVRAYRDPQLAQEYAGTLKKRGYSARVLTGKDPEGVLWYRIHVGRFATSAEAQRFATRFNVREGEKAIAVEGP